MTGDDSRTYALMVKPIGALCNLRCAYCYYLDKKDALGQAPGPMNEAVLEAYIRQNFAIHGKDAVVEFSWHGGEPTLLPMEFYQNALKLQKKYGPGRKILNTLQTNGTLLNDDWCAFFAENRFQIGVSIDGPREFHDQYRVDASGGSFDRTLAGIRLLKKHGVIFNTLTTVNAANWASPAEVYGFLRELTDFMQFLPVVETGCTQFEKDAGLRFARPPGVHSGLIQHPMTDFSVPPAGYGRFLCGVLDEWKNRDIGKKHVMIVEATIGNMLKKPAGLCAHEPLCGHSAVIEANGDVYSCDRYVFPAYRLGNLLETPLSGLMEKNRAFGMHKIYGLPEECLDCRYIKLCFGGCPKDRILLSRDGRPGKNYLCESYQLFFKHFTETMRNLSVFQ